MGSAAVTNPSKARGTRWESAICAFLNGALDYSHPADWRLVKRAAQTGARDVGDIHCWPFILEAKDVKSPSVPAWLRQADTEATNAGFPYGVVVHKTRGKGPALARVHIDREFMNKLIAGHDLSGCPVPVPNPRGYYTWTLAEFAEVLRVVRSQIPPPQ